VLFAITVSAVAYLAARAAHGAAKPSQVISLGHSVRGRPIVAVRLGDPDSPRKALVVGVIHGDEPAGLGIVRSLRRRFSDIHGVDLWTVTAINPDGLARHTRRNARGVDLNRNFSYRWRGGVSTSSDEYPGPAPFSEPESRAVKRLVLRLHPDVTVWYHQPWGQVLAPCHGDASVQRTYAAISGLPMKRCRAQHLHGTAIAWQNHRLPGTTAFVVELPAGRPGARAVLRNARAAARVSRDGAGASRAVRPARGSARISLDRLRPRIRRWFIPFPPRRKNEMAAYSKRHYGKREWRLHAPKVIVEHIAVAGSAGAVYSTFAPDVPDPELHELPGVCSHFVIGSNGRIHQLVHLTVRCRHTVGLNYTSIGIEHVGFRDGDVLGNRRQLRASVRLTRYLRCRFGIAVRNVIGHNESLSSPYHLELVPGLKHQTHGDWRHASMRVYRRKLRRAGRC
jgi:hypothetical protein